MTQARGRPKAGYFLADGVTRVPSVTTITGRFKESGGLIYWAWEQGKAGKDFREERDAAASAGSLAHALVAADVLGEDINALLVKAAPPIRDAGWEGYQNWKRWTESSKLKAEVWERPLVCEHHKYGGTPDTILWRADKVGAPGDWKTGGIHVEHLLQLAAYRHLFLDAGVLLEGGFHLGRFSREHGDFSHHFYGELNDAWEMFLHLRAAYDLDKLLQKRVK